jgi:pimeloyl-ACP methyl ester carboxylesterase
VTWIPHHALVAPEGEAPAAWLLFLHGILGSGANWRTVARRLVAARPDWGAVLVDLRMHGRSQDAPPPHTLAAVAADLDRLARDLAGRGMPVAGVIGHSFGGKAALAYRQLAAAGVPGGLPAGLIETWVLDASPSPRPDELPEEGAPPPETPGDGAGDVVLMLESLPGQFSGRDDFVAQVTGHGFSRPLAEWLAMNLDREGGGVRLRLDLAAVRALLADHFRQDLWPAVESRELPGALRFVVAGRSRSLDHGDRRRLQDLSQDGRVGVHILPDTGHWLHMEAPDALLRLFSDGLTRPPRP